MDLEHTYYDFAEQDVVYFLKDVADNRVANYMATMAHEICEKYLKHLVDKFYEPTSEIENSRKIMILETHNVGKLLDFIEAEIGIKIPEEKKRNMAQVDAYYFTTKYPGEHSFFVSSEDIEKCKTAVTDCQKFVNEVILQNQKTKQQEKSNLFEEIMSGNYTPKYHESKTRDSQEFER